MYKIIIGFLLLTSTAFGYYYENVVDTNGMTNIVIHLREEHTELHCYWETGNYSSNIVARLRAEDAQRIVRTDRLIADGRFSSNDTWIVKQRTPRYNHITTNTVHWSRAHPATTNDPYIVINTWHEWGYVNLYWKEKLTDTKWERIIWGKTRHDPRVPCRTKIHMHPESSITKRMLKAKTGFFCQSPSGPYTHKSSQWTDKTHVHEKLYSVDLSNFFPEPIVETIPSRSVLGIAVAKSSGPPPLPTTPAVPVEKYWLNTSSGTRHNNSCIYFENTSKGEFCDEDEGTPCKVCGG
jgi:hypothetical protein